MPARALVNKTGVAIQSVRDADVLLGDHLTVSPASRRQPPLCEHQPQFYPGTAKTPKETNKQTNNEGSSGGGGAGVKRQQQASVVFVCFPALDLDLDAGSARNLTPSPSGTPRRL